MLPLKFHQLKILWYQVIESPLLMCLPTGHWFFVEFSLKETFLTAGALDPKLLLPSDNELSSVDGKLILNLVLFFETLLCWLDTSFLLADPSFGKAQRSSLKEASKKDPMKRVVTSTDISSEGDGKISP